MIGRTNAGGGKEKHVSGTFTAKSNSTGGAASVTIPGIGFEPKKFFVKALSASAKGESDWVGGMSAGWADFERGISAASISVTKTGSISFTKDGDVLTIKSTVGFARTDGTDTVVTATHEYHIYG